MILHLDMTGKELVVTKNPEPKSDQHGDQRFEKETSLPLWSTEVVCTDESGGEILRITTAGEQPDVERGDIVTAPGIQVIPWATNGRSGRAFRANNVIAVED